MVRLLKPLSHYKARYGTWAYGLNKLYLMMEKQHNRGQEAAGLAALKLNANPGEEFMFRERAMGKYRDSTNLCRGARKVCQLFFVRTCRC